MLPALLIHTFGVDVPNKDEWDPDLVGLYVKVHQHSAMFHDFVQLHSEHRLLVPRLMLLPLYAITHGNTMAGMYLGWLIACGTSLAVLWLILRSRNDRPRWINSVLWLLSNVLIFSIAQWENWLIGIGLVQLLVPMLLIGGGAVAVSEVRPWPKTLVVSVFAIAVTYTSANGLLAWPLLCVLLAVGEKWINPRSIAFTACGVVFVSLYFVGYHPAGHSGTASYAKHLGSVGGYAVAFLGAPFAFGFKGDPMPPAYFFGSAMLALYAAALISFRRQNSKFALLWLLIGGFVIGSAMLAGVGRGGLDRYQALSSRYISFTTYLPVSLVMLAALVADDLRRRAYWRDIQPTLRRASATLAFVLVIVIVLEIPPATASSKLSMSNRLQGKGALLLYTLLPNNPALNDFAFSDRATQSDYPAALDAMGYLHPRLIRNNVATEFEAKDVAAIGNPAGVLETLDQDKIGNVTLAGWAVLQNRKTPADTVFVTCDDAHGVPIIIAAAQFTADRPDVQARYNVDVGHCGWSCTIARSAFPPIVDLTSLSAWTLDANTGKAFRLARTN